jgi:hypothetical protein
VSSLEPVLLGIIVALVVGGAVCWFTESKALARAQARSRSVVISAVKWFTPVAVVSSAWLLDFPQGFHILADLLALMVLLVPPRWILRIAGSSASTHG